MRPDTLTQEEHEILLSIARNAISKAVNHQPIPFIDLSLLPEPIQQEGASFVTLTIDGDLRGCIGTLQAHQPLALDVQEHAIAAALQDYRFPRVTPSELPHISIEISYLTQPEELRYTAPSDLIRLLRPGIDGVILSDGRHKATFLPQVWEKLPDPKNFLRQLCLKMGASADLWQSGHLSVQTYQVEEFQEARSV